MSEAKPVAFKRLQLILLESGQGDGGVRKGLPAHVLHLPPTCPFQSLSSLLSRGGGGAAVRGTDLESWRPDTLTCCLATTGSE